MAMPFISLFMFSEFNPITVYAICLILSIFWFRHLCDYAWESETEYDDLRIMRHKRAGTVLLTVLSILVVLIGFCISSDSLIAFYVAEWKIPFMIFTAVIVVVALYYFAFIPDEGVEKTWKNFFSSFFKKGYM